MTDIPAAQMKCIHLASKSCSRIFEGQNLESVVNFFNEIAKEFNVPPEELTFEHEYEDDNYSLVSIWHERLETEDERIDRVTREEKDKISREKYLLKHYLITQQNLINAGLIHPDTHQALIFLDD